LLVEAFLPRLSPDNLTLLAMVARSILHRRNSLVFEGKFKHSNDVFSETTKALEEFSQYNSVFRPPDRVAEGAADSWLPPPSGSVKINWDAALNKNMGFIGLGYVAPEIGLLGNTAFFALQPPTLFGSILTRRPMTIWMGRSEWDYSQQLLSNSLVRGLFGQ